jgi:hypothetical protein
LENAILIKRQRVAKSASSLGHLHRLAQQVYMPDQQIIALPLQQINGKEICAARCQMRQ